MSRETYVTKRFNGKSVELISTANGIIEEYQEQGYDLTLRQLYYQFVARDLIENTQRAYKRLGAVVSDARLAGLIDWSAITDRTRTLRGNSHWSSPEGVIDSAYYGYREDKWSSQPTRVEAWIEKDALLGVISRVCTRLDIDYFSCRGYPSQSAIYTAAQRFKDYNEEGQKVVVLHLGDHDPSGLDMTRDINDRLKLFEVPDFEVRRIALTPEQVSTYNPPRTGQGY